ASAPLPGRGFRSPNGGADRGSPARAAGPHRPRHARTRCLCHRGGGAHDVSGSMNRPFSRDQRATIIYGMLIFVLIVVVLQLWLLTTTMNAWLGGDEAIVWP